MSRRGPARQRGGSGAHGLWLAPPPHARDLAGWALLPLRAFLGVTFTFAGLQKLANPGFFSSSDPASIQAQLGAAAHFSPLRSLLLSLGHVAVPLGLMIAFGELAVGLGTLVGLRARVAAVGGAAISFGLFLTVSFHSSPYYTGADIVFFFAWLPLIASGAGPLSLDAVLKNLARRARGLGALAVVPIAFSKVQAVCGAYAEGTCTLRRSRPCEPGPCPFLATDRSARERLAREREDAEDPERRAFLAAALALGAVGVVGAGTVAGIGRLVGGHAPQSATGSLPNASPPTTAPHPSTGTAPATTAPPSKQGGAAPPGHVIGPASDVPVGGAASFTDPATGDPALVIHPDATTFLAFDAICPHAGCMVEYAGTQRLFVCPCHGSVFNGRTGAVEVGPAQSGLTPIRITKGPGGQLYAV